MRVFLLPRDPPFGKFIDITGDDFHYLVRVRRVRVGDTFPGSDGLGGRWVCRVLGIETTSLRLALEEYHSKNGLLKRVMSDPGLANKVDAAATNVQEITEKLNRGDGTLAQLINKSELFDEISRVVTLLRESIEDAREQAPINTFVNAIFAAF